MENQDNMDLDDPIAESEATPTEQACRWTASSQTPPSPSNTNSTLVTLRSSDEPEGLEQLLTLPPAFDVPPEQRVQTPRQMACTLMEHQKVCLTWLIQKEEDPDKRGGILADTMGLGKTVQALALVVARPSSLVTRKTTLIIAPLALLRQWEKEIAVKIKPAYKLKTTILYGEHRWTPLSELMDHDIVLCTYGILRSEYRNFIDNLDPEKLRILDPDAKFHRIILDEAHNIKNKDALVSRAATVLQANYRLCMTGTPLMNYASEIFPLLRFLNIDPYNDWASFSRDIDRPIMRACNNGGGSGMDVLRTVLRTNMLRRNKNSSLDGRPILQLPPRIDRVVYAEFDQEQNSFYRALEHRQRLTFNKYLKAGTVMKNYFYILVLLLRLRQACNHPHLIKDHSSIEGADLSQDEMRDLVQELDDSTVTRIKLIEEFQCPMCRTQADDPVHVHPCGHHICLQCFTASVKFDHFICPHDDCGVQITPRNIFMHSSFVEAHMETEAEADDDRLGAITHEYHDEHDAKGIPSFDGPADEESEYGEPGLDTFHDCDCTVCECEDCWTENCECNTCQCSKQQEAEADIFVQQDPKPHNVEAYGLECTRRIPGFGTRHPSRRGSADNPIILDNGDAEMYEPVRKQALIRSTAFDDAVQRKKPRSNKRRRIDRKINNDRKDRINDADDNGVASKQFTSLAKIRARAVNSLTQQQYRQHLRADYVSSVKIDKIMSLLGSIRQHRPKEKTLIFSLWPSFLDLLEVAIEDAGFVHTRYDGQMNADDRYNSVQKFQEDNSIEVMLVSLTAGNAGLNLTAATQVIVVEPFWNPYVEEQAIDRAHRIGQTRPVTVHRLLVRGTVEDRILSLQEKKRNLASTALEENGVGAGAGAGAGGGDRLTVGELEGLFGSE